MTVITVVKRARKDQGECELCGKEIKRGDPYKWVQANRFSPRHVRCDECRAWHLWEYSDTLDARIAQIEYLARTGFESESPSWESVGDCESFLATVADDIEGLAEEKREAAQNIEDGFGHTTEKSDELTEQGDNLESWAEEFRGADVPEYPDPVNDDEREEWRNACETLLDDLLGNNPV